MIMFDPLTVLAIALKTSLLIVIVGLIAWLMAKQSAAWRHALWTAALALSLLMPIAVVVLPSWVQVPLPARVAEPWARDVPVSVTSGARSADSAPEAPGPRKDNRSVADSESRAEWSVAMIV
jgi:hypothetical protein